MRVYTFQAYGPALVGNDKLDVPTGPRIGWNNAAPTVGYWSLGDIIFSNNPATTGIFWVCTEEGAPGLWAQGGGNPLAAHSFIDTDPSSPMAFDRQLPTPQVNSESFFFSAGTPNIPIPALDPFRLRVAFRAWNRAGDNNPRVMMWDMRQDTDADNIIFRITSGNITEQEFMRYEESPIGDVISLKILGIEVVPATVKVGTIIPGFKASHIGFSTVAPANPGNLTEGDMWYDGVSKKLQFFDGTAVRTVTSV